MLRYLITGCAGFIGSNLCNKLYDDHIDFIGVDNLSFGYEDNIRPEVCWIRGGFENLTGTYLNQFDVLVHLACANLIFAQDNQVETFRQNALNTFRLFREFKGKIVYTSTSSVYGQARNLPTNEDAEIKLSNAYDQSKYLAEMYLQLRGNFTTLRLSNVYGRNQRSDHPYSGVIGKMIGKVAKRKPIEVFGEGTSTRDYTYIDDVLRAIMLAVELPAQEEAINIGTGKETSITQLAYMISNMMSAPMNVTYEHERSIDGIKRRCLDIQKAKNLGWEPEYDIENGLKETLKYYE